ncbi:MAG: AAA family ATPase [Tumebacillaceae bacterium]
MEVKIQNFNMIKYASVKFDGLTVIAGENNTGKSTLGKLIFSIIKAHNMNRNRQKRVGIAKEWVALKRVFSLVFETDVIKNTNVSIGDGQREFYKFTSDGQGRVQVQGDLGELQLFDATYIESPVVWSLVDFFTTVGFMREEENLFGGFKDEIKYPYLLWDTYKKLSSPAKAPNPQEVKIRHDLLSEIRSVMGGSIQQDMRNFYFKREADQTVFPVTNIATGIKSFGILEKLIEKSRINANTILVIDEPEVHLHPEWELHFAKVISTLVRLGVRVVVTTHSMYMVRALREYTRDRAEQVRFYLAESPDNIHSTFSDVTMETQRIYKKFADPLSQLVWGEIDV